MSVRYPNMYNGMYRGNLSDKSVALILDAISKTCIPGLKKMIFDFPADLVQESLESGVGIRDILERRGEGDYSKYIGELRDYQTVGAGFMYLSPRSILGDGVGSGKTVEISALLNIIKVNNELTRFLAVVEKSAVKQFQLELLRFTGLNVIELPSQEVKMRKVITTTDWSKVDGVVTAHSALRSDLLSRWLSLYLNEDDGSSQIFNTVILDESSVVKNRETKTGIYIQNICNIVSRVHFLNATTFDTSIMDVYNQIDIMCPNLLHSKSRIEKEYCIFKRKEYWGRDNNNKAALKFSRVLSGYKNQEQFKNSLKLVYFGRAKAELPHSYKVYTVYPTEEQMLAIAKGYRYMEVLNSPSNVPEIKIPFDMENVPKLSLLVSLILNKYADKKVMVYVFNIEAQVVIRDTLAEYGIKSAILNGDTSSNEVECVKNAFNEGDVNVVITNKQKSLNLYNGDVCIFYSMSFTPSKLEQIRGRIDRSVDDKLKTFIMLLYKGTAEYKFFVDVVKSRSEHAKELTINARSAVDFFIESMERDGEIEGLELGELYEASGGFTDNGDTGDDIEQLHLV